MPYLKCSYWGKPYGKELVSLASNLGSHLRTSWKHMRLLESGDDCSPSQHIDWSLLRDEEPRNAPEKQFYTNVNQRKFVLPYQISHKDFIAKSITIDNERPSILKRRYILQEDNITPTFYAPNLDSLIKCKSKFNSSKNIDKCTTIMSQVYIPLLVVD